MATKEYSNGEIAVIWKPKLCIHSGNCTKRLPEVFKPNIRPWVQIKKASTEEIKNTVEACPSGALSYQMKRADDVDIEASAILESTKVNVLDKGPLMVYGSVTITHTDGTEEEKEKVTAFCRCGNTSTVPFCDGSHKNIY